METAVQITSAHALVLELHIARALHLFQTDRRIELSGARGTPRNTAVRTQHIRGHHPKKPWSDRLDPVGDVYTAPVTDALRDGNLPRKGQVGRTRPRDDRSQTPTSIHTKHGCVNNETWLHLWLHARLLATWHMRHTITVDTRAMRATAAAACYLLSYLLASRRWEPSP